MAAVRCITKAALPAAAGNLATLRLCASIQVAVAVFLLLLCVLLVTMVIPRLADQAQAAEQPDVPPGEGCGLFTVRAGCFNTVTWRARGEVRGVDTNSKSVKQHH